MGFGGGLAGYPKNSNSVQHSEASSSNAHSAEEHRPPGVSSREVRRRYTDRILDLTPARGLFIPQIPAVAL